MIEETVGCLVLRFKPCKPYQGNTYSVWIFIKMSVECVSRLFVTIRFNTSYNGILLNIVISRHHALSTADARGLTFICVFIQNCYPPVPRSGQWRGLLSITAVCMVQSLYQNVKGSANTNEAHNWFPIKICWTSTSTHKEISAYFHFEENLLSHCHTSTTEGRLLVPLTWDFMCCETGSIRNAE
jgi:hypothetical protein